jgi:hypothetical protein
MINCHCGSQAREARPASSNAANHTRCARFFLLQFRRGLIMPAQWESDMTDFNLMASIASQTTGGSIAGAPGFATHNINPARRIWAVANLQSFQVNNSNMDGTDVKVTQFKDAHGTHNISQGFLLTPDDTCTQVTYTINVGIASASALCVTTIFLP